MMRKPRLRVVLIVAGGLIGAGLLWYLLYSIGTLAQDVQDARAERDALATQVEQLGGEPVVRAKPGEPGPPGPVGPPPSDEQVRSAVHAYCSAGDRCEGDRGPRGRQGERGPRPTSGQVAAAVRAYCDAHGNCQGPAGKRGEQGERGVQGPPPSDAQVRTAVAAYCGERDGCRGPEGPQGPQGETGPQGPQGPQGEQGERGPAGADGRGITDISDPHRTDDGDCVLTVTYTRAPESEDIDVPDWFCRPSFGKILGG